MAFYLTYRPAKIADLDLKEVRETLWGLLAAKSQPHALLLTGIRGAGKTSSARIWAKALCCSNRQKIEGHIEPCLECAACVSISKGSSLDVIEIDAASHRGIDDIRELRDRVSLAPTQLPLKIYIIDEVHMLTTEAFNALLKTLEEPPAHVRFVLCTTEVEDLPETILSRCVQISFRRASIDETVHSLSRVVKGESLMVTDDALEFLARMGEGSFRDATKYLEEVAWMEGEITTERLEDFYHVRGGDLALLIESIHTHDIAKALGLIEQMVGSGADMRTIVKRLLDVLHGDLLAIMGGKEGNYFKKGEQIALQRLLSAIDRQWSTVNFSLLPQLPLELALMEWNEYGSGSVSNVHNSGTFNQNGPARLSIPGESHPKTSVNKPPIEAVAATVVATPSVEKVSEPAVIINEVPVIETVTIQPEVSAESVIGTLLSMWTQVLAEVKVANVSVEAFLRVAKPVRHEGDYLVLEVPYSFHRDKLQEDGNRRVVEEAIAKALGVTFLIRCEMSGGAKKVVPTVPREVPASTLPAVNPAPKPASAPSRPVSSDRGSSSGGGGGNFPFRRRTISTQAPVPTEEDEALVNFAEELFGGE